MYLTRGGGYHTNFTGFGAVPEGAALLYHGVVSGIAYELRFRPGPAPAETGSSLP
jgi:hypothetical protein